MLGVNLLNKRKLAHGGGGGESSIACVRGHKLPDLGLMVVVVDRGLKQGNTKLLIWVPSRPI